MKRTRKTNRTRTNLDTQSLSRIAGGFGGQELGDALTDPTPRFGGEDVGPDALQKPSRP